MNQYRIVKFYLLCRLERSTIQIDSNGRSHSRIHSRKERYNNASLVNNGAFSRLFVSLMRRLRPRKLVRLEQRLEAITTNVTQNSRLCSLQ